MSRKSKVTPKLDLVFKKIFSDTKNTDILIDFISTILGINPSSITDIEILDNELKPESLDEKFCRLDIKITINKQTVINIEMQVLNYHNYKERVLFYWAKLFIERLSKNEDYINLKATTAINIINFNLFECENYHSMFKILEENRHELLTDKLRIDFLELRKAKKGRGNMTDKKQMWMDFLNTNAEDDETLDRLSGNSPIMQKAVAVLRKMSADEKELYEIERREKALRDETAARAYEREQGKEEGKKEGEIIGKIKSILNLINNGFPKEQILAASDMDETTFNSLIAEYGLS